MHIITGDGGIDVSNDFLFYESKQSKEVDEQTLSQIVNFRREEIKRQIEFIEIGDNTWIGEDCYIYNLASIKIGSNVSIAHKNFFNTGGHDYKKPTFDIFANPIIIEDEVWITSEVYISPGVKISKGAVIGVRSAVFNDIPEGMLCYGNPAKVVKKRNE